MKQIIVDMFNDELKKRLKRTYRGNLPGEKIQSIINQIYQIEESEKRIKKINERKNKKW